LLSCAKPEIHLKSVVPTSNADLHYMRFSVVLNVVNSGGVDCRVDSILGTMTIDGRYALPFRAEFAEGIWILKRQTMALPPMTVDVAWNDMAGLVGESERPQIPYVVSGQATGKYGYAPFKNKSFSEAGQLDRRELLQAATPPIPVTLPLPWPIQGR
jgi:hypothetical protein